MAITVQDLIAHYDTHNPEGHFFEASTMKFFGDTISNFAVRKKTVKVDDEECYVLYRKKPVKHGLKTEYYFTVTDCKRKFK